MEVDGQAPAPADQPQQQGEDVNFVVVYGKVNSQVSMPSTATVGQLKQKIEESTRIVPSGQKLLNKGKDLKDDTLTLQQAGVKSGTKLMLIGTPAPEVEAAKSLAEAAASGASKEWDNPASNEPMSKQQPHAKIIEKGRPEGETNSITGIKGRQVPLSEDIKMIAGLMNSQGTKVRLTFKEETRELWIGSATHTQRVPYGSISKIESFPIEGQDEYSILALHLGAGKYWLYWFPSQHVAAVKIRILGVESLL